MKIDWLNAKILKELLKDGRKTFTEIAQECGESMEVVANRYRQMKKQGIIVGATIQNSCACYDGNFVTAFYIYTRFPKSEVAAELLRDFPNIVGVYPSALNPSLHAIFTLKSIAELERTKQALKELPEVLEVDPQIWVGVRNTPHNLSVLGAGSSPRTAGETIPKQVTYPNVDEVDRYIIEKLIADSRIPFSKIAGELKISTDTVSKRYERLKQNRHVRPVIQINPSKIGYNAFALFRLTFSEDSLTRNIEDLMSMPDFNLIHKISGKYDCWASLMIKDINQFTSTQEKIHRMSNLTFFEVSVSRIFPVWPLPREFISTF
jgi:Lrp/AsnC family transcriptional regulator for asnA, asnC and gidA